MAAGGDRIRNYYIFRAVTSFSLWMPFWTLWAYKNLDSYFLLTLVDVGFWTTMMVFQVPAGLLGDKYGRKRVLFAGELLAALGILGFGLSTQFWQLFASNIFWAMGVCFVVSGDTPFVYDTLVEVGRAKEFIGVMARAWSVQSVVNAIACVTGGVLVQWVWHDRFDLTLIISAVISMVGTATALLLKEPVAGRKEFTTYKAQLSDGWKTVRTSKAILVLIMFQLVIEIATYVMAVFRSVYMNETLKLDSFPIGLSIGAFTLFAGIVATQAGRIEEDFGEKNSLLLLLVTIIGSFAVVFAVGSWWAIVVQFPIYAVYYIQSPIIGGYINRRVDSSHRSTVMGISTLIFTIALVAVEVPSGFLANAIGTRATMAILAIAITPIGLYLLSVWNKEVDASKSKKKVRILRQF
jgi:MFS family permease